MSELKLFVVEDGMKSWLVYARDPKEAINAYLAKEFVEALMEHRSARVGPDLEATWVLLHPNKYLYMSEAAAKKAPTAQEVLEWAERIWESKKREVLARRTRQLTLAEVGVV